MLTTWQHCPTRWSGSPNRRVSARAAIPGRASITGAIDTGSFRLFNAREAIALHFNVMIHEAWSDQDVEHAIAIFREVETVPADAVNTKTHLRDQIGRKEVHPVEILDDALILSEGNRRDRCIAGRKPNGVVLLFRVLSGRPVIAHDGS